jgi:predicted dehydrogenase
LTGGRLRLALVGCGAIVRWHLSAIAAAARRTVITAAVDVDRARAEAIARETGARPFTSLEEALASRTLDAVLIMLPHDLHEDAAVAALAAGQHVLLEKPMAPTVAACERILAAARASGRVFMVAENSQYWPEVLLARDLMTGGAIGEIVTARAWLCSPPIGDFYSGERPWRFSVSATGGGVAIDAGSHWLRPLRMWLGELVEVLAATARPFPAMEGESMCRALCRFATGVVASFDVLLVPGPVARQALFQVTGTAGEIVIEPTGEVRLFDRANPTGTVVGRGNYRQSYDGQIADFEAAALDGRPPAAGAEVALGELRGALAMYRSAESKRWEPVW